MTIDDLLNELMALKKRFGGGKRVLISNDSEGNEWKTIDQVSEIPPEDESSESEIVIYPTDDVIEQ